MPKWYSSGMKLDDYLRQNNLTEQAFADLIGTSQATVNRYRNGRIPEPEAMERIVKATTGAVQPNDFYQLSPIPAPEHRAADNQKGAASSQPLSASNGSNASSETFSPDLSGTSEAA